MYVRNELELKIKRKEEFKHSFEVLGIYNAMNEIKFFEGYIRNLDELCLQLSITTSDEKKKQEYVLTKGYKKWGTDLPIHLKGYFSFELLDLDDNCIFCARDRFGVIPFYYTKIKSDIYCDCYIRNILKNCKIVKMLNEKAVQLLLSFGFVPGEETLFLNIRKLMPGYRLICRNGNVYTDKYYELSNKNEELSMNEYVERIHATLIESSRQMENPDGAFLLSSGVDSNYLYAISNINKAFSIGFKDVMFDESVMSCNNAHLYNKKCEKVILDSEEFFNSLAEATANMEQPVGSPSSVAFMIGCKYASKYANVCYTGEGSDEIFAGYEIYKKANAFSKGLTYLGKSHFFEESEKRDILLNYVSGLEDRKIVENLCPRKENCSNLMYMLNVDMNMWLESESFINTFKMSRAFGIEIRMPFIDEDLVELGYSIPDKLKIQGVIDKYILRKASEKVLPQKISYYQKRGFVTPIRQWMACDRYKTEIISTLNGEIINEFFIKEKVNNLYTNFFNGNQKLWRKIWLLYSFAKWYEIYF